MASKRKQKEKKKDFVKPKLRVGKTAPKASNHTDTSFVAKSISLPSQSLNVKQRASEKQKAALPGKSTDVDLTHHLSLTKHHSSTTRKEVLLYIEQHLPSNPSAYNDLLNAITPMILDQSQQVRETLVQLLRSIAMKQPNLIELHTRSLVLFIHSAMSHIQPPLRADSTRFLEILIDHGMQTLAKGYFVKTLKMFCQLMNWQANVDSKKSLSLAVASSTVAGGNIKKTRSRHLQVLKKFIEGSVFIESVASNDNEENCVTIHPLTSMYMMKTTPQPYAHLKLFIQEISSSTESTTANPGAGTDLMKISCEDVETRKRIFVDHFHKPIEKGLSDLIKEGGELGKEANTVLKVAQTAKEAVTSELAST